MLERVAGAATHVEHDLARLALEQVVERSHVDAADDARTHLVVDERMSQKLAIETRHGALSLARTKTQLDRVAHEKYIAGPSTGQ